jgi:predicted amino acid-binding ACT domain protein
MIYEVDVPLTIDPQALARDLRAKAETLQLDINFQHRRIFETLHRI